MDPLVIGLVSACTALVASNVGPIVTLTVADHQRLDQAIETALERLQAEESTDAETEADIEIITKLAQSILKREWQRVKLGV